MKSAWITHIEVCVFCQESHCNYHNFAVVHAHACGQLSTLWLSELSMKPVVCVTSLCPLFFVCISPRSPVSLHERASETKMKRGNVQQGKQTAPSELQACPGEWPANVSQHWILLLGKHRQISPCARLEGFRFCSETDLCPLVNIKSMLLQAALQKHLIQREAEKQALKSLYLSVCIVIAVWNDILNTCEPCTIYTFFIYMQGTPGWPTHA